MAFLLDELSRIVDRLNEDKIDYAICGGIAMAIHGFPRATVDIDIIVDANDLERVWRLAKEFGFEIEGMPLSLHGGQVEIRRISKIEVESKELLTLDFLLVTEELRDVWDGRQKFKLANRDVSTVSRTGLIKLKTLAGRTIDKADIESLTNER